MHIDKVLAQFPKTPDRLLEILLAVQGHHPQQYLPEDDLRKIASYLDIPESRVCGVVSFYTFFSTVPRGRHVIQVCENIPCHVNGAASIITTLGELLGVKPGETTEDGQFTLETASCLGCCDEPPVMRINDKVYHHLTPDKIKAIISEYREVTA
ncbi:MAG: NADH-quinone oxidoreductase subunit NuoE [Acholeplasmataceae bacterium]|nr:MAG: NADH-quinone oxidoreductase subunit NuoE [Acholeplasmataceae bacterium]